MSLGILENGRSILTNVSRFTENRIFSLPQKLRKDMDVVV